MALTKVKGHILADDLTLPASATTTTQSASDNSTKIATTAYVTTAVSNLVDGAPSTLNTLNEIAAALNDDAALNTTLTTSIAAKLPLAGGTLTGDLTIPNKIIHAGDTDTYLSFANANDFRIVVGNSTRAAFNTSKIHFNQEGIGQDFQVESDNSTHMLYVDASADAVGIGISNPTDPLVVKSSGSIGGGATNANSYFTVTDGTYGLFHDPNEIFSDINGVFHIGANHANGALRFHTGGTANRMDITSNGTVLIGTTSTTPGFGNTNGHVFHVGDASHISRDQGTSLIINRGTNDGTIVDFRRAGTQIGTIGVAATDNIYFAGSTGSTKGIYINNAAVYPANTGGDVINNAVDLGQTGTRWKNIYSSGIVYISDGISNAGAAGSATVFNEDGTTADFRVESDGNEHMFKVDGGTNNVGIATSNPNKPLTITSDSGANAIALRARSADDYSFFQFFNNAGTALRGQIYSKAAGDIAFTTGTDSSAGNDLYIKNGTGVGIGCEPGVELDIKRTNNATPLRIGSTQGQGRAMVFADVHASPTKYNWLAGAQYNVDNAYEITPSTAVGGYTFSVPSMVFTTNGNVGINCSAPEEKLTIDGGLKIANSNKRLYFGTEGSTSHRALEGSTDGNVIQVGEGYTNVLLGSASAKVGIRQTSPAAMLHIDGATDAIPGMIIEGNGNGDEINLQLKTKANNGTLSYHGVSATAGADQDDNTISLGNGADNGVVVNHQNVVRARYSEIHSGGTFSYDVGGNYLGANGSGFGTHAIFRTPLVSSPSSGAASTQFLTVYGSGHWGEYCLARFRLYTTYFQGGYREYLFRMVASTCNLEEVTAYGSNNSIGQAPGTITKGSVSDTGTDHSGQNIYKVDLTFASTSAYYRNYVVAEINYGSNKYYSSGTSSSAIDGYTNGGKYHFKTISLAEGRGKFVS